MNSSSATIKQAKLSCAGKLWWPRLLLLLWMMQLLVAHLMDAQYQSIFKGLDLGVHEMGHAIFMPFGEFIGVAGGSFFQCLVPFIGMAMFLRQRDYFGIAFAWGWLSVNLFDVSTYIADARAQQLDLVSPFGGGDEIIHDWNYLLSHMHLLQFDINIARLVRFSAVLAMLFGIACGGWLVWQMYKQRAI